MREGVARERVRQGHQISAAQGMKHVSNPWGWNKLLSLCDISCKTWRDANTDE